MATDGHLLPRANVTWYVVDAAITIVAVDDPVELARRRDGVAKRARDEDLREEADAVGWSSAIPERSLALHRRRGSASSSLTCGTTKEEQTCSREVAPDVPHGEREAEDVPSGCGEHFFITVL